MLRKSRQLIIKNLWLEEATRVTQSFVQDVQRAINRFATWQEAEQVIVEQAPHDLLDAWTSSWTVHC